MMVLKNLIPIVLIAVLIALGLAFIPNGMVKGFQVFGRFVIIVITVGLAAAIVEALTGITLIPGMDPGMEEPAGFPWFWVIGGVVVVAAGVFVYLKLRKNKKESVEEDEDI